MEYKAFDIVAIGEAMVELNQVDPACPSYLQGFGGDTSNTVIAAARQGACTAYLTRVGADHFGQSLRALWTREGVDASGVQTDEDAPTGIYFVHHDEGGHNFTYRRAGSAASRARSWLGCGVLQHAACLHISAVSQAIGASACDAVFEAIDKVSTDGGSISYDPNFRPQLWPLKRARAIALATLAQTDYFFPSMDDALALSGLQCPDAIVDWAHRAGAKNVLLKMGAQGALVSDGKARHLVDALRVDAVDATGAGDSFDGACLARLADGDDLRSAASYAVAVAALTTTGFGAVAPIPSRERVLARMAGRG